MSSLLSKLQKSSKIKETAPLTESKVFGKKDQAPTHIPMLNVALSGKTDGGLSPGLLMIAGNSKHFKSAFAMIMASAYMNRHDDAILLFYDSEFGTPLSYFDSFNIDTSRVLHTPITNVEELKNDISNQLENIERDDKVIIVIDSIGNLASKKEVDDAKEGKNVADMSRAKQIKSLFRIITPHLTLKHIPMVAINHTYQEMCVSGDTKIRTETGLMDISKVMVGDMVITDNGVRTVTHKFTPTQLSGEGKRFMKLTFQDGSVVRCTHDHKFKLESGEWKNAEDITDNDELITVT